MKARSLAVRRSAAAALVALGVSGLAACSDSAGPEAGAVSVDDLRGLEQQVMELDERVGTLEDAPAAGPAAEVGSDDDIFGNAQSFLGEDVTVSGAVSELVTAATDLGSAFRIGGDTGEPVAVLSATPPPGLMVDDVVRVSGTVMEVQRDTFQQDFGVAADELFDDPDAFFSQAEGQPAISADRIEVLQEQADN